MVNKIVHLTELNVPSHASLARLVGDDAHHTRQQPTPPHHQHADAQRRRLTATAAKRNRNGHRRAPITPRYPQPPPKSPISPTHSCCQLEYSLSFLLSFARGGVDAKPSKTSRDGRVSSRLTNTSSLGWRRDLSHYGNKSTQVLPYAFSAERRSRATALGVEFAESRR